MAVSIFVESTPTYICSTACTIITSYQKRGCVSCHNPCKNWTHFRFWKNFIVFRVGWYVAEFHHPCSWPNAYQARSLLSGPRHRFIIACIRFPRPNTDSYDFIYDVCFVPFNSLCAAARPLTAVIDQTLRQKQKSPLPSPIARVTRYLMKYIIYGHGQRVLDFNKNIITFEDQNRFFQRKTFFETNGQLSSVVNLTVIKKINVTLTSQDKNVPLCYLSFLAHYYNNTT